MPTTFRILTPEEYTPFSGYDAETRTHTCDCWICGAGAVRKSHNNAVKAAVKMGIRVQFVPQSPASPTGSGYGNRCPNCYSL